MASLRTDARMLEELTVLPKRRLNFSITMKQQAIAWIRGPGRGSPRQAVPHFRSLNWEVTPETMDKWWKNRVKIMNMVEKPQAPKAAASTEPKWIVMLSFEQELALAEVIRRRVRKVRVSAKWIGQAIQQMYPDPGHRRFRATSSWLRGFTQRHGLELVGANVTVAEVSHRRRSSSSSSSSAAPLPPHKTHTARSMSLMDVIHEDKPPCPTITA